MKGMSRRIGERNTFGVSPTSHLIQKNRWPQFGQYLGHVVIDFPQLQQKKSSLTTGVPQAGQYFKEAHLTGRWILQTFFWLQSYKLEIMVGVDTSFRLARCVSMFLHPSDAAFCWSFSIILPIHGADALVWRALFPNMHRSRTFNPALQWSETRIDCFGNEPFVEVVASWLGWKTPELHEQMLQTKAYEHKCIVFLQEYAAVSSSEGCREYEGKKNRRS